jgi:hypothetical protein
MTAAPPSRQWRGPIALVALVLLGGAVIALLQSRPVTLIGNLDPADPGPSGTHALADLLAARGTTVIRAITPAAAEAAARSAAATLVVTSPGLLTARQLAALARVPGDRVLVAPDPVALTALAPRVAAAGGAPVRPVPPDCPLAAARLAGNADLGGLRLRAAPAGTVRCYPSAGLPALVRYGADGRVVTVLGTGLPLTNQALARLGNAALALNLLDTRSRVVWLVPGPGIPAGAGPAAAPRPLTSLIPAAAYLVALQLVIAVVAAALWRARRLGPLVPEPLPVVVRAAETVDGHARLYQARRARGRAASALRAAMLSRTAPALGLPSGARPGAQAQALAARSGRDPAQLEELLFGPAPRDDGALAALADDLDALEREVRAQ